MKANLLGSALALVCLSACAGQGTPAEAPSSSSSTSSPSGVTAAQPSNNPARALAPDECKSLGQWLADACQNRPNERSARVDGWCSDLLRGVESGAWVTGDCAKHVTYIDSVCFRSTRSVHDMMACDESVARP